DLWGAGLRLLRPFFSVAEEELGESCRVHAAWPSLGHRSGRNLLLLTPVIRSTSKTRLTGTSVHCVMAWGVIGCPASVSRCASLVAPPTDCLACSRASMKVGKHNFP